MSQGVLWVSLIKYFQSFSIFLKDNLITISYYGVNFTFFQRLSPEKFILSLGDSLYQHLTYNTNISTIQK